ncbi:MAG: putative bifunctional diguanylate cyclase/phosphodiesterase [Yoonia sp.]
MYQILACITYEHHYGLLSFAVMICLMGSVLTVLLLRRMIVAKGPRAGFLWALSSVIGGTTIWSTHFTAMLAFEPGFAHSYDPGLTALSLATAAVGLLTSNGVLTRTNLRFRAVIAGALFGLTVSVMHYIGMSAYLLPGDLVWIPSRIASSVLAGAALGAFSYHRILHPFSKYCWLGGAAAMVLAICAMHFTGMTAFTVMLDSSVDVPEKAVSDMTLGILVTGVTAILFMMGFTSFSIQLNIENETRGHLRHAASHDHLTGLPNRLSLSDAMEKATDRLTQDETYKVSVLSIDLDLFKQVNDMHGHAVGDVALLTIATRLTAVLQDNEFIARTGGDEFVAIKQGFRRVEEVKAFATRLHARIIEPIVVDDVQIILGASIGIATSLEDGRDIQVLAQKSDHAMYRAKTMSDSHICMSNADIHRKNQELTTMIKDLRVALKNNEFELVYQLQNTLTTLEAVGFECLLRWNHPTLGRISPNVFIPLAEQTGLIRDIGIWVMRTACFEAASWDKPFSIAVNVAPQQLVQSSFLEQVADIIFESGLDPSRLELEITEASMIDDQVHTLKAMHQLKDMGLRIAMDDFGTGYSSLATLQAFPFDKIKIDRSFISDVHINNQRAAIVRSTLLLGAAMDIPILAEGVETELELNFLRAEKCSSVQGFFFGKPLSLDEVHAFMQSVGVSLQRDAG